MDRPTLHQAYNMHAATVREHTHTPRGRQRPMRISTFQYPSNLTLKLNSNLTEFTFKGLSWIPQNSNTGSDPKKISNAFQLIFNMIL